jgi:uncharacterized protein (TIGR03083 family)
MASPDVWPTIHGERAALIADLEPLTDTQWDTPSLCADWTVRQVLGHMTATAEMTPGKFFGKFVGAGFNFNKMAAKDVTAHVTGTPADTLARFKAQSNATTHPPGPIEAMVGEAVIHSEDIRRPLGIARSYPTEVLAAVADFYKGSNLIVGTKKRIAGLTLEATDTEWSTGSGLKVSGPLLSLILAMTGRHAIIDDLSGEGVATLKERP